MGSSGQLAGDGADDYTWTQDGTLTGTAVAGSSGSGVLDFTDRHTDLTGQFTPAGTALAGSQAFGPWGAVTATGGVLAGSLGFQSQYTSGATGQVDMGARWYNPAAGSFGNKDTVANSPVPDSASASPFGYAADSPLDLTDPTGHYVTACSGPLTPAQQRQEAAQQKASISAAANAGARQAAAARTAPLDAHLLHLLHLAHLAAAGQSAKAAPVKKPAAAPVKPYDGPVTCAEGALTQCMNQAYAAGGGQYDAHGIPNGKGYVPPVLSPAQVSQQDNAARQARKQATDTLKAAARTASKPPPATSAGGCGLLGLHCLVKAAKQQWDNFASSQLGGCLWSSKASDCATAFNDAAPFLVAAMTEGETDPVEGGLEPLTPAGMPEDTGGGERLPWTSWQNYPNVTLAGREYAQIGDRLYTQHAVDRMQPSGLGTPAGAPGPGRSISPNYIEDVLNNTQGIPVKGPAGEARLSYLSGSVQVITEDGIVITVITR